MQYRYLTRDKLKVSLLGFGCMRFPVPQNDLGIIDEVQASEMLKASIQMGLNYIDTAYPYHSSKSEAFVGKVLKDGLRDKIYLATKSPVWLMENYGDFMKYLDEQLVNLQTNFIDFYLLHALNKKSYEKILSLDVFKFIQEAKDSGKIKYIGFSFHDELPVFKDIIDSYDWDFCQIQLNYMDREYQAGLEGLKYARDRGIDVVVMEPLKGGKLSLPSNEVRSILSNSDRNISASAWALKWVEAQEGVKVVLSGMSSMEHVHDNVSTYSDSKALTAAELSLIDEVTQVYKDSFKIGCTACQYCIPCPSNVNIPTIFELYNNIFVYGTEDQSKEAYKRQQELKKDVSQCIECGACEQICPQHLEVISLLKEAHNGLV